MESYTTNKINLYFKEVAFSEYIDLDINAIRLCVNLIFKCNKKFTDSYRFIVDTGAPLSLVPPYIWKDCDTRIIRPSQITGVVPLPECSLPVTLAEIVCKLVDQNSESREFKIKAHLAHTDEVPMIVGFKDLLDCMKLEMDYKNKSACLIIS